MPELPEIHHLAAQIRQALSGRKIARVTVKQPKCLNVTPRRFAQLLDGRTIDRVASRGKWIFAHLKPGVTFLLSLGMGGDVLLHEPGAALPDRYQVRIDFAGGTCLTIRFWWFGYAHAVPDAKLASHRMTGTLGLNPLDRGEFTPARFRALLAGRRGTIKALLMDQRRIAGIGNVYIQDILFRARLHPGRPISKITDDERASLYRAITGNLAAATRRGGLAFEKDLYNRGGGVRRFLVGYREGKPCPVCGTAIRKIRAGATASFICPQCQT
ncbi:MAG TPA: DNA-formamidopyrimidine glycosylase family protein [Opitutaceae bacterium]|nr:DNA-formamidopyrimidine glycosylase family protein [Opitutaceae bacterium]